MAAKATTAPAATATDTTTATTDTTPAPETHALTAANATCRDWEGANEQEVADYAAKTFPSFDATARATVISLVAEGCSVVGPDDLLSLVVLTKEKEIAALAAPAAPAEPDVPDVPETASSLTYPLLRDIQRAIRKSWNRCGQQDVCIPGEPAKKVNCTQPDPQVGKLDCFVTTHLNDDGSSAGYNVGVTFNALTGEYQWGLNR